MKPCLNVNPHKIKVKFETGSCLVKKTLAAKLNYRKTLCTLEGAQFLFKVNETLLEYSSL